jgi:hypothetical protein
MSKKDGCPTLANSGGTRSSKAEETSENSYWSSLVNSAVTGVSVPNRPSA